MLFLSFYDFVKSLTDNVRCIYKRLFFFDFNCIIEFLSAFSIIILLTLLLWAIILLSDTSKENEFVAVAVVYSSAEIKIICIFIFTHQWCDSVRQYLIVSAFHLERAAATAVAVAAVTTIFNKLSSSICWLNISVV